MEHKYDAAWIDGDSLIYLAQWACEDLRTDANFLSQLDQQLHMLLENIKTKVDAAGWHGCLSAASPTFRHRTYKYYGEDKYKANRAVDPMLTHLKELGKRMLQFDYGFSLVPDMEADDLCHYAGVRDPARSVVVSNDKDLKQTPCDIFDPRMRAFVLKKGDPDYLVAYQMLVGDATDNIAGLPGYGEAAWAKHVASALMTGKMAMAKVYDLYLKHFGPYYGDRIFNETKVCIQLMGPEHLLWIMYERVMMTWYDGAVIRPFPTT